MTEERKFAILIAATILSVRKLAELEDPDKLTPKKVGTVENSHSTRGLYSRGDRQEVADEGTSRFHELSGNTNGISGSSKRAISRLNSYREAPLF
jgi:hypothetical protein